MSAIEQAGADQRLKSYIDRILRLRSEMDGLQQDVKEVYAEAKSEGFDKTAMGKLVAALRKGEDVASEEAALIELYTEAYHRASHTHTREAA